MNQQNLSFLSSEVKSNDYYRYLCCCAAPKQAVGGLLAIYAFNNEIAKIKDHTSEPMAALVRLTWWREAIDEIYANKNPRKHQVLEAIKELIQNTEIPRALFDKMLDARENDINRKTPEDIEELKKYIDASSVDLLLASLYALKIESNPIAREFSHYVGIAYAVVGIMRAMKWNAAKNYILFPRNMLEKHQLVAEDLVEGRNLIKAREIARELCDKAEINLRHAKAIAKDLPKEARPIYQHYIIAKHFLNNIKKNKYELFNSNLETGRVWLLIKMFVM